MDTDESLFLTLERGLSGWVAPEVRVSSPESGAGTTWRRASLLGEYFPAGLVFHPRLGTGPRRFLKGHLTYTPSAARRPLMMLAAAWQTAPAGGLRSVSAPLMTVTPDRPEWRQMLILPQAQRVRVLDFSRGVSRVFLRVGAPPEALMLDVVSWVEAGEAPFPRIRAVDPDGLWYEEDLIDGVPLPLSKLKEEAAEGSVSECLRLLERAQERGERRLPVREYVSDLVSRIGALLGQADLSGRERAEGACVVKALAAMATPAPAVGAAGALASEGPERQRAPVQAPLDTVGLVLTHGEVVKKNVLVPRGSEVPVLVGRGAAKERSRRFDRMFYRSDAATVDDLGMRCALGIDAPGFAALFFLEVIDRHLENAWNGEGRISADRAVGLLTEARAFLQESGSECDDFDD
jgi:hypothetical protein